ncbi:organic cation transporter protein-like [Ornithodoros turicata]|uniref:organic cation transporter protein-like n=1 Tax=Ornithodoros turicata TaxID=34597 RepID=UPI0031394B81
MTSIEDVLVHLGPWHFWIILFCFLRGLPTAYHTMAPTFAAPSLDHWCAKPSVLVNWTSEQWRTIGIPLVDKGYGTLVPSRCEMYAVEEVEGVVRVLNRTIERCSHWDYDLGEYTHTLTNQFDLVCDRVWLRAASQSFYMAGLMVGSFVYAHVSDWYGRKTALALMLPVPLVVGCITAFSTSFLMYNIGRMLASFGFGGLYNTSYTLMMESVAAQHRALGIFLLGGGWTTGLLTLVAFVWFIRDWFYLQLAISLAVILNVMLWFLISESPRWLLATQKFDKAREVLDRVIRVNKVRNCSAESIVKDYRDTKTSKENMTSKPTFIHLFSSTSLRKVSIIVSIMAICNTLEYYNLTYTSILLGSNPYLSFALVALSEFPSRIMTVFLVKYVRRRTTYMTMYTMGAVCSGAAIFVSEELWWLQLTFVVLAKLGTSCAGAVCMVQLPEMYPTRIRTLATGFSITMSRVGAMIAPFTKELGVTFNPWVPRAVDVGVCALLLLLGTLLPETFNLELPDTMEDVKLRRSKGDVKTPAETEALRR